MTLVIVLPVLLLALFSGYPMELNFDDSTEPWWLISENEIELKEIKRTNPIPIPTPDLNLEEDYQESNTNLTPHLKHLSFEALRNKNYMMQISINDLSPRTIRKIHELVQNKGGEVLMVNSMTSSSLEKHERQQFLSNLHLEDRRHYPRILSIDGGGMRGIITLEFLLALENLTQKKIYQLFDIVIGVSTGAIIAAGIAKGMLVEDILKNYKEMGPKVFSKSNFSMGGMLGPQYSPEPYTQVLTNLLGDMTLGDCKIESLFVTYNQTQGKVKVFSSREIETSQMLLRQIVMASSAAQTIFPPVDINGEAYVDGGGYKNNPTSIGLFHACDVFKVLPEECIIVSLGTGITKSRLSLKETASLGKIGWAKELVNNHMDGESDHDFVEKLVKFSSSYFRIQYELPPEHYTIERVDNFDFLSKTAQKKIKELDLKIDKIIKLLVDPRFLHKPKFNIVSSSVPIFRD